MSFTSADLVTIDYETLTGGKQVDLSPLLEKAYGRDGLGALTVANVPGYAVLREKLLPLAQKFAALPDDVKVLYEDPDSQYQQGWSHGKESLSSGQPDRFKGSFYANPLHDQPPLPSLESPEASQYPTYYRPNMWPAAHLPELEGAFKQLGQQIIEVGTLLLEKCERYLVSQLPEGCAPGAIDLLGSVQRSHIPKGRLLHYFPPDKAAGAHRPQEVMPGNRAGSETVEDQQGGQVADDWCGWHLDHGSLTGLTSSMFIRDTDEQPVGKPDPSGGLYIRTRKGPIVKVNIPEDHIAYQLGEVVQIQSGGLLQATPHCVKSAGGPAAQGVSRNTFAVFMQPGVSEVLRCPPGIGPEEVGVAAWKVGQTFGEFAELRFSQYYG